MTPEDRVADGPTEDRVAEGPHPHAQAHYEEQAIQAQESRLLRDVHDFVTKHDVVTEAELDRLLGLGS